MDLNIDLSGNPLGVLRGKNKKDGGKYSASRIKSTATATAASYMNLFKKSLKDVGIDAVLGVASAESDDEEEKLLGEGNAEEDDDTSSEFAKKRCGAKAMVNVFLNEYDATSEPRPAHKKKVHLGLRHCFFDHEAADALAALIVEAKDRYGADISIEVAMNPVLEDDMVDSLHGEQTDDDSLREMAERHLDILQALQEAQERAAEARAEARKRVRQSRQEWDEDDTFGSGIDYIPIVDSDDDAGDGYDFRGGSDEEDSYR